MKKKANVVMLSTEKATSHISRRNGKNQGTSHRSPKEGELGFCEDLSKISKDNENWDSQHLYFTQDRVLKVGDIYIGEGFGGLSFFTWFKSQADTWPNKVAPIIVSTTNPELWKRGIEKIGLDFAIIFVKKSNAGEPIKEVMLQYEPKMQKIATGEEVSGSELDYNLKLSTRSNGTVIISPVNGKEYTEEELFLNMQYYMEHCQLKGYVTPQDWLQNHKHF